MCLLPSAGINVDLGNGPGVHEMATFSVAVAGAKGAVEVSHAHGVAGGVPLGPFACLTTSAGDGVTTLGYAVVAITEWASRRRTPHSIGRDAQ